MTECYDNKLNDHDALDDTEDWISHQHYKPAELKSYLHHVRRVINKMEEIANTIQELQDEMESES